MCINLLFIQILTPYTIKENIEENRYQPNTELTSTNYTGS